MSFEHMETTKSLSVIVPAYNEEINLAETIESIVDTCASRGLDYEILIVNDGSTDGTRDIAIRFIGANSRIRLLDSSENQGLGRAYRSGVMQAAKDNVVMIPGDNEIGGGALSDLIGNLGKADILIPFPTNTEIRPFSRRIISKLFTGIVNAISGNAVEYYNGAVVHRKEIIQCCPVVADGFAYQAKILVYLLNEGRTCLQIPTVLNKNKFKKSSAFRIRNVISVARSVLDILLFRITSNPAHL